MKGTFPIDKFQEIQTPFYYYDTNVLRQTLKTINAEAGKHEAVTQVMPSEYIPARSTQDFTWADATGEL